MRVFNICLSGFFFFSSLGALVSFLCLIFVNQNTDLNIDPIQLTPDMVMTNYVTFGFLFSIMVAVIVLHFNRLVLLLKK